MRLFLIFNWLIIIFLGLYLSWIAPAFEMPDRLAPGCGWWITPPLSRALGLSLLAVGGAAGYIFFLSHRRQPLRLDPLWQILYFSTLVVPALVLILLSAIAAYGPLAHTHQPPAAQVKCMR